MYKLKGFILSGLGRPTAQHGPARPSLLNFKPGPARFILSKDRANPCSII